MADTPAADKDVSQMVSDLSSKNPDVSAAATEGLVNLEPARAVPVLLEALTQQVGQARQALSSITQDHVEQVPQIAAPIAREMLSNAEAAVRATGAWALGFVGNPMSLPGLLAALKDPADEVRARAAEALGSYREHTDAVALLFESVGDKAAIVRAAAAHSLGYVGGEKAVTRLLEMVKDAEAVVREETAFALGLIADVQAKPALRDLCEDTDAAVQASAEEALQRMEHSAA